MKILRRQIYNNLLVGLLPLLLVLIALIIVNSNLSRKNADKKLKETLVDFKQTLSKDLDKFRDYSFFIMRDTGRVIDPQGHLIDLHFPVNVNSYNIRLFEVFYHSKLIYHDTYSWQDHIYFASKQRAQEIYHYLSNPSYSIYFKMSFPEVVSNTLIVRNCSILADRNNSKKIGFASVITPIDQSYLSELYPVNQKAMVLFIQTKDGITYSNPDFSQPNITAELLKSKLGEYAGFSVKKFTKKGKFYCLKENLYSVTHKVSRRIIRLPLADVGILYDYEMVNRNYVIFRNIILLIMVISFILFPLLALFSAKEITNPIYALKNKLEKFRNDFIPIEKPQVIHDEIDELTESSYILSSEVVAKAHELEEHLQKMESDIQLAKKIQKNYMINRSPHPSIAFYFKPMEIIGGDFFEFFLFDNGDIGVFISDVSGHGVPAALVTSMVKSFLVHFHADLSHPEKVLESLNNFLFSITGTYFVTAFFGIIKVETLQMEYAMAGHPSPILITREKADFINGNNMGLPLGVVSNSEMNALNKTYKQNVISIPPHSKLLFYTDGLSETVNYKANTAENSSELMDFESVYFPSLFDDFRDLSAEECIDRLSRKLVEYRGKDEFDDDVCMIFVDVDKIKQKVDKN